MWSKVVLSYALVKGVLENPNLSEYSGAGKECVTLQTEGIPFIPGLRNDTNEMIH